MGRFLSVDPLSNRHPEISPYAYVLNNPIRYTDPTGLFEDEAAAKQHAKDNGIKTGWFRRNKIRKQDDGQYAIENRKENTFIQDYGEGIGVLQMHILDLLGLVEHLGVELGLS